LLFFCIYWPATVRLRSAATIIPCTSQVRYSGYLRYQEYGSTLGRVSWNFDCLLVFSKEPCFDDRKNFFRIHSRSRMIDETGILRNLECRPWKSSLLFFTLVLFTATTGE